MCPSIKAASAGAAQEKAAYAELVACPSIKAASAGAAAAEQAAKTQDELCPSIKAASAGAAKQAAALTFARRVSIDQGRVGRRGDPGGRGTDR